MGAFLRLSLNRQSSSQTFDLVGHLMHIGPHDDDLIQQGAGLIDELLGTLPVRLGLTVPPSFAG